MKSIEVELQHILQKNIPTLKKKPEGLILEQVQVRALSW